MQASALLDGRRLIDLGRRVDAGDAAIFLLLASVLWLPPLVGNAAWPAAVLLLWALAIVRAVRLRRFPPLPTALALYVLAYVPAALRAADFTPSEGARFFVRPLLVPAVVMAAPTEGSRRRQLILIVLFALTQTVATAWEALSNIVEHGRNVVSGDHVTGTLGASQAGIVALVVLAALTLLVSAWVVRAIRTRIAALIGTALVLVTIFASMRAAVGLVVVLAVAVGVAAMAIVPVRVRARRPLESLAASIVAAGAIYVGIVAIYPNAFAGAISSQSVSALGGVAAYNPVALTCSAETPNVVSDPGFESGLGTWTTSGGGSLAIDKTVKRSGAASLRFTTDGRRTNESSQTTFATCPHSVYTAAAWVKAAPGVPIELELSDNVRPTGDSADGNGQWEYLATQLPFQVSKGFVAVYASSAAKTTIWADDVQVVRGAAAGRALLKAANPCIAPTGENHIANAAFDSGIAPWRSLNGARVSAAPDVGHEARGALRVVSDGIRPAEAAEQAFVACRGRVYTAAAWVRATRGARVELALSDQKASVGTVIRATGTWQQVHVSLRFHLPTGVVSILTPGSEKASFVVDDVAVVEGRVAPRVAPPPKSSPPPAPQPAAPAPTHVLGTELLPGRVVQIKTALSVSTKSGALDGLLGRGLGASTLQPGYTTAPAVPKPQRVGSTWIGVVLVDSGWLGLAAFASLLVWLLVLSVRISANRPPQGRMTARVLVLGLPGVAVLTLCGAILTTILDVRGYSIVFWILVGLGVSAALDTGVPLRLLGGGRAAAQTPRS